MDKSYEENIGRIPRSSAFAASIALYIIAITAAVLRGFVRWHYRQLRLIDDGFVVFAVACLTVVFGLWISYMPDVYITEALIYEPFKYLGAFGNIIKIAVDIQTFSTVYIVISLSGIFAIKFSFLFFFRQLIDRIHKLQVYWRIVASYTAIVWIVSVGVAPVACPFYDARAIQCAQGPYFQRALDISIVLLVFDVTSDFLIISIPIILLRQIKIPLKSKIYLGMSLCLSTVMIVVAILQGATITFAGVDAIDVVWELFFQFVEVTLAILVVSLTAFRTLFIGRRSKTSRPSTRTPPQKKWYSNDSAKKAWNKLSQSFGTTNTDDTMWSQDPRMAGPLPTVNEPDETFTEMRSLPDRRASERKYSSHENGLSSHPTLTSGAYGGTTLASHSDPEPYIGGTLDGPLTDMPIAMPEPSPPADEEHRPFDHRNLDGGLIHGGQLRSGPRRPRSQISAERRISYWQRMIRVGFERAQAVIPGRRSDSLSDRARGSVRGSPRSSQDRVSPVGPSPERSPVRRNA